MADYCWLVVGMLTQGESHCVMPLLNVPQLTETIQPINRMLCSINTKPTWHHTINGNTQLIHSHTTQVHKSGST